MLEQLSGKLGVMDYKYMIYKGHKIIKIQPVNSQTLQPVQSKSDSISESDAILVMEKRTDVPWWEVAWTSSPEGSQGVGTAMYLMALELAEDVGLSTDSIETSQAAMRVWTKFMNKKNPYDVVKSKKEEFKYEEDTDPFYFVFKKKSKNMLKDLEEKNKIIYMHQKEEPSTAERESDIRPFDPDEDWDEYIDLD